MIDDKPVMMTFAFTRAIPSAFPAGGGGSVMTKLRNSFQFLLLRIHGHLAFVR